MGLGSGGRENVAGKSCAFSLLLLWLLHCVPSPPNTPYIVSLLRASLCVPFVFSGYFVCSHRFLSHFHFFISFVHLFERAIFFVVNTPWRCGSGCMREYVCVVVVGLASAYLFYLYLFEEIAAKHLCGDACRLDKQLV